MAEIKSSLVGGKGIAAAPANGLFTGGHLRAAVVSEKASADGDTLLVAVLPPNSVLFPALSAGMSGMSVTVNGGAVTLGSGKPVVLRDGGKVIAAGEITEDKQLDFVIVYSVLA